MRLLRLGLDEAATENVVNAGNPMLLTPPV